MKRYGYQRTTTSYTVAIISYTEGMERKKEKKVKITGIATDNKFELYNYLIKTYYMAPNAKPFVHEVVKSYYWEE